MHRAIPPVLALPSISGSNDQLILRRYDLSLFDGQAGWLYEFSTDHAFTDIGATTPVSVNNDAIAALRDLTQSDNAQQSILSDRPLWQSANVAGLFDGATDRLTTTTPLNSSGGTMLARVRSNTGASGTDNIIGSASGVQRGWISVTGGTPSMGFGGTGSDGFQGGGDIRSATAFHTVAGAWTVSNIGLYVDGVQENTGARGGVISPLNAYVGARNVDGPDDNFFDGEIANALLINRTLLPFEIANVDAFWDPNLVLMALFEGVDGATQDTDDSQFRQQITFQGNADLDTSQARFGTSSLRCQGSGDYVTISDDDRFDFAAGSWTMEGFFRWTVDANNLQMLMGKWQNAGDTRSYAIFRDGSGNNLQLFLSSDGSTSIIRITANWSPTLNTWHHICADFDGTTYRLYADGALLGSSITTVTLFTTTQPISIGAQANGTDDFEGFVDQVRFYKGRAKYLSDTGFTVPGTNTPLA